MSEFKFPDVITLPCVSVKESNVVDAFDWLDAIDKSNYDPRRYPRYVAKTWSCTMDKGANVIFTFRDGKLATMFSLKWAS